MIPKERFAPPLSPCEALVVLVILVLGFVLVRWLRKKLLEGVPE